MAHPPFFQNIDNIVTQHIFTVRQRTGARHSSVDTLVADVSLSEEADFSLEDARHSVALADRASSVLSEFDTLGEDLGQARKETDLFLAEHSLARRPAFGTLPNLALGICIAATIEVAATAPIYEPSVGWANATVIAVLISVGVAVPAILAGLGVVGLRHRRVRWYRLLGLAALAAGGGTCLFALACGAHFREIVAAQPAIAANLAKAAEAIIASFATGWLRPLLEPSNWGLAAAGGLAWAFTAWKTFRTFGYIGWRDLALEEQDLKDTITDLADEALAEAEEQKRELEKQVSRKVKQSVSAKWLLERLRSLDGEIYRSAMTALTIGAKHRAAAYVAATQTLCASMPHVGLAFEGPPCPAATAKLPDRSEFQARIETALARHDALIADERRVLLAFAERHHQFCEGLRRATARALGRATKFPNDGPTLPSSKRGGA